MTRKRYFNQKPEHNHLYPEYQQTLKRPMEQADMSKPIGWFTILRVRKREHYLVLRFKGLRDADELEESRFFIFKLHARIVRYFERSLQEYEFERSLG